MNVRYCTYDKVPSASDNDMISKGVYGLNSAKMALEESMEWII